MFCPTAKARESWIAVASKPSIPASVHDPPSANHTHPQEMPGRRQSEPPSHCQPRGQLCRAGGPSAVVPAAPSLGLLLATAPASRVPSTPAHPGPGFPACPSSSFCPSTSGLTSCHRE